MKRATIAVVCVVLAVAGASMSGCSRRAPQLSAAQLQAGIIPPQHPVSQQVATSRGCACHTGQQ